MCELHYRGDHKLTSLGVIVEFCEMTSNLLQELLQSACISFVDQSLHIARCTIIFFKLVSWRNLLAVLIHI